MTSGNDDTDHFLGVTKMIEIGKGGQREIVDIMLTRYACYLIAQNGDPSKDAIAFAQTYFADQTRKQEAQHQTGITAARRGRKEDRTSPEIGREEAFEIIGRA